MLPVSPCSHRRGLAMASGSGLQLSPQESARARRFSPDHGGNRPRAALLTAIWSHGGWSRTEAEMRCSLGVAIFLALSCLPLHAQEQANSPRLWLEIGQGIVCDTLQQIQRFVGLRGDGMGVSVAL